MILQESCLSRVEGGRGCVCENAKWQEVRTPEPGKSSLLVARRVPPGWAQGGREAGPLPDGLTSSHVISNFLIAPQSHIKEVFALLCFVGTCIYYCAFEIFWL